MKITADQLANFIERLVDIYEQYERRKELKKNQVNWLLKRIVKFRKKLVNDKDIPVSLIRKYDKHFEIL